MPHLTAAATALPPHRCDQDATRRAMAAICRGNPEMERLLPIFDRTGVEARYFAQPLDWYLGRPTYEQRNDAYRACALELAETVARRAIDQAGLRPDQIDQVMAVTTTGLMTPSLEAPLAARLGMREDVRRVPLFGLGCAGGAGGVIRSADVLAGHPAQYALLVSVELCSLVFSPHAKTSTDLVGAALFGDGAAAVVIGGDDTPRAVHGAPRGPAITATRSHLFTHAPDLMGWRFTSDGMRLVLSRDVPSFVASDVKPVVDAFLTDHTAVAGNIAHYLLHPGGAKVMATYRSAFGLSDQDLDVARRTMRRYGNQSSASVLFMLSDLLASGAPRQGDVGLMVALGPGFAAEMLLLTW